MRTSDLQGGLIIRTYFAATAALFVIAIAALGFAGAAHAADPRSLALSESTVGDVSDLSDIE